MQWRCAVAIFVKVLEDEIAMPVWELIAVRMSLTWLGCYICASRAFLPTKSMADARMQT